MRKGTWARMKEWIGSFKQNHKKDKIKLGFGGWLCLAARVLGTVILAISCLGLLLPFVAGATWAETIILVAAGLLISRQFLYFHHLYLEAESVFLYIWEKLVRGREWTHFWAEDPDNPANKGGANA